MICPERFPDEHHPYPCLLPAGHAGWHRAGVISGHVRWGGGSEVANRHDRTEMEAAR